MNYQTRLNDEVFVSSAIEEFLLPPLAGWANFNEQGSCYRKQNITYLDFKKLQEKLALNYQEAAQLQYLYNIENEEKIKNARSLSAKERSYTFYNSSELIVSGSYPFKVPSYQRVHLINLDSIIKKESLDKELFERIIGSEVAEAGHPVLISNCYTFKEVTHFLEKNNFHDYDFRILTYQMENSFNQNFIREPKLAIPFEAFFSADYTLYHYQYDDGWKKKTYK